MTAPHFFHSHSSPVQPSHSSYQQNGGSSAANIKRKRTSWCMEDYSYEQNKHFRVRSPPLDRRQTYSGNHTAVPDLMVDSSVAASDEDQAMDGDVEYPMAGGSRAGLESIGGMQYGVGDMDMDHARVRTDSMDSGTTRQGYPFGNGGSGGFGFGPGAQEDVEEEDMGGSGKASYPSEIYPSLTPHPNPHHFSNPSFPAQTHLPPPSGFFAHTPVRSASPLSAQAFSTTLRAPSPNPSQSRGLMQPAIAAPLPAYASDVEKARAVHGPHCKGIPQLRLSEYPDAEGKRSMWTCCPDCGATERVPDRA